MPKGFTRMRTCPHCGLEGRAGGIGTHIRFAHNEDREAKFWARIDKNGPNGCWIWAVGARDKWGYGDLRWDGKHVQAHRLAWKLLRGDPGKLDCLHKCDNPPCCNPDHIYLGTDADNHRDMRERGRTNYITRSKLTEDQVREIRSAYSGSNAHELAAKYAVSAATIWNTTSRRIWKHVQ